jgi:glycosyltransferase 2 family protein
VARVSRKALWVKLAVLALLAWFVATRVDLGDRLVLRDRSTAAPAVELDLPDGETLRLGPADTAPVEAVPEDDGAVELWTMIGERRVTVPPELVAADGPLAIRPGLRSSFRAIRPASLLAALAVFAPICPLLAWRWGLLLRAAGVRIGWAATVRLTWIGLFFNTVVPGGAGGDVVKLIEVGRYSSRRSEAFGAIVADRVIGMLVLVALGVSAAAALGGEAVDLALGAGSVGLALLVGGAVYASPWLRRRVDVGRLLGRLPFGAQLRLVDESLVRLSAAPGALIAAGAISLAAQVLTVLTALFAARAVGLHAVPFLAMLVTTPVALVANSIPISPGGLGLMEVAFQELMYRQELSSLAQGFMVGALLRSIIVAWSLPGLIAWLVAGRREGVDTDPGSRSRPTESGS